MVSRTNTSSLSINNYEFGTAVTPAKEVYHIRLPIKDISFGPYSS